MSIEEQTQVIQEQANAPIFAPDVESDPAEAKPPCQMRNAWKIVAIIAAVCLLLTGVFLTWLCIDSHPKKPLEESGAVTFPLQGDSGMAGNKPGYPFTFLINEEGSVQWDITVNCGTFLEWRGELHNKALENLGKAFFVDNGSVLYWTPFEQLYYTNYEHRNRIYIEAVIYTESHIVGYCVIQVHRIESSEYYRAEILDSAYYPPQKGEYQNITLLHIQKQILKAKILG